MQEGRASLEAEMRHTGEPPAQRTRSQPQRVSSRNDRPRAHCFGLIAIEDLPVRNMTRSAAGTLENPGTGVAQKRGLNRSITEQTWGMIRLQLNYKAEWGRQNSDDRRSEVHITEML